MKLFNINGKSLERVYTESFKLEKDRVNWMKREKKQKM
jgi:hypothetical protein